MCEGAERSSCVKLGEDLPDAEPWCLTKANKSYLLFSVLLSVVLLWLLVLLV